MLSLCFNFQQKHKLPAVKTPTFFDVSHHEGDCNCSATSSLSSLLNERFCRICHEPDKNNDLLSHCQCKGSVGLAHTSCLIYWIKKSGSVTCELCKHKYVTVTQINKRFWQVCSRYLAVLPQQNTLIYTTVSVISLQINFHHVTYSLEKNHD